MAKAIPATDNRVGQLMRNGKTVYYVTIGQAVIESYDAAECVRWLDDPRAHGTHAATYRLGSANFVFAPGLVEWAMHFYRVDSDKHYVTRVIADTWGIPHPAADDLLSGKVPYRVEGETVIFTCERVPMAGEVAA